MLAQHLTIAYACLNAIGNSLELESMISEILITFSRKTRAESGYYFANNDNEEPMIKVGKEIDFKIDKKLLLEDKSYIVTQKHTALQAIILPLQNSYLQFIYEKPAIDIDKLSSILENFRKKIIISINACHGVKELQTLNKALENRVQKAIEQNRHNEKMLLVQSKQAVMGEMVEMIAHQWRQPITAIGLIANNLLFDLAMNELNPEIATQKLENINSQVAFLSETIDNFRNFFKSSKTKEDVSVKEILESTLLLVQKQLDNKSIELHVDNLCNRIVLYTFKNELIQVLLNIISNAKDALSETQQQDKTILIKCETTDDITIISIEDNADGIAETVMPHIFEPYFSTKTEKNGTGLGLYMSKTIVHDHMEGSLKAYNTELGAKFVIQTPTKGNKNNE